MDRLFHDHLRGDRTIWMVALLLGVVSLLAVYSSISSLAFKHEGGSTLHFLFKHGMMLLTGGLIMYYAHRLRFGVYSKLAQMFIWVTLGLLVLTLLLGTNLNDASRWLRIPVIGQSFQTSDLAKVVLVLYLARVLAKQRDEPWTMRDVVVRLMVPAGAICGAILPANFSTAALLFMTCMVLFFIAEVPIKYLLSVVAIAIAAFALLLVLAKSVPGLLPRLDTWITRVESFGTGDPDTNYQVDNAKVAIVNGGLLPNGPGTGTSRNFLPHPYSDMIYAFIVEEYGSVLGGTGLLLLYLILLGRAVRIAARCPKRFGSLAAIGLSLGLVLQAMVNMAVAVNLVPVTGQPLPLVSMGGTSTWFTCLSIGIVLSISRSVYDEAGTSNEQRGRPRTANAVA
ncbi:MAG: FtsW/RodA/SpoVE family cell cycle protein [Flavobacteriales bacterium]|nr:FtsW/RodA/SpoVE family cell cycle protein [Flavobacteriales bacterium]MCB9193011.1 FtsW/RodA/SpoVE family cell cycle protein [Flavobacteriales bacterium]